MIFSDLSDVKASSSVIRWQTPIYFFKKSFPVEVYQNCFMNLLLLMVTLEHHNDPLLAFGILWRQKWECNSEMLPLVTRNWHGMTMSVMNSEHVILKEEAPSGTEVLQPTFSPSQEGIDLQVSFRPEQVLSKLLRGGISFSGKVLPSVSFVLIEMYPQDEE